MLHHVANEEARQGGQLCMVRTTEGLWKRSMGRNTHGAQTTLQLPPRQSIGGQDLCKQHLHFNSIKAVYIFVTQSDPVFLSLFGRLISY